jgi:hypothetical protein
MADGTAEADLRAELRLVEEELAGVRRAVAQLRAQIGGRSDGAVDPEDTASAITAAEEQEALAEILQARRDRITAKLNAPHGQ